MSSFCRDGRSGVKFLAPRFEGGLSGLVSGVRLTCHNSAHLAGEAVPIQNKGSGLFREASLKSWKRPRIQKEVLAGLQITPVVVGENLVTFFGPELADAPAPLTRIT